MTTTVEMLALLLRDRLGIEGKPDLRVVAERIGLRIKEVDVDGFDGTLVTSLDGPKGIIGIRRSIRESTRKRFTIAHEIGHYAIPAHKRRANVCFGEAVESWYPGIDTAEMEANQFAAELLLPSPLMREQLDIDNPSFSTIRRVARIFETSLTATTCRLIDLTDQACAVVWSEAGRARWYRRSAAFSFYLPKPELPARGSHAESLFSGGPAPEDFSPVGPELWLDRRDAEKVQVLLESSVLLPQYNAVLTVLWAPGSGFRESGQTEEGDEDEEIEWDPYDAKRRKKWPR